MIISQNVLAHWRKGHRQGEENSWENYSEDVYSKNGRQKRRNEDGERKK